MSIRNGTKMFEFCFKERSVAYKEFFTGLKGDEL